MDNRICQVIRFLTIIELTSSLAFHTSYLVQNNPNNHILIIIAPFLVCFQACARKRSRPHVTRAVDEVISEVDVSVDVQHTDFYEFLEQVVEEHRNRYGYVSGSLFLYFFRFYSPP